jgi:hypothetical protein
MLDIYAAAQIETPEPPIDLGAAGARWWEGVIRGRLPVDWTPIDLELLAVCAKYEDEMADYDYQIDLDGYMIEGHKGALKLHPLIPVRNQVRRMQLSYVRQLNLTVSYDPKTMNERGQVFGRVINGQAAAAKRDPREGMNGDLLA